MLEAKNIHKNFSGNDVLKGASLTVNSGEITCLVGPSGVGKTTLLRALALLDLPDQGEISISDKKYSFPQPDAQSITPPWPELTVVFQSLFLWPHLTLRENILLPSRAIDPNADDSLQSLIDRFQMGHFIDNFPNQASLGQRQRVALARAVMLKPQYILMDEITSALDVEQVAKVLDFLQKLRDDGIGIFIITHLLGFAKRASDKICFMSDGQIIEQGTPKILDKPKSKRLKEFVSVIERAH